VDASLIDEALEQSIETVIRIKNLALNLRTRSKAKIRQPLSTLYVRPRDAAERRVLENTGYAAQVLDEANVKELVLLEDETALVKIRLKADAKKIGPRAGKHLKAIGQALEKADPKQILNGSALKLQADGKSFELAPEEILISYEGPQNVNCGSEQGTFVALDTTLTPELLREGLARDFNRLLQDQRKALNLDISDRIAISYTAPPRIADAIASHEAYLRSELLAERLESVAAGNGGAKLMLNGEEIMVTITRM